VEECLFRGLIQDAILYRGMKRAFYRHIHSIDMHIWTVARILIGSSMFGLAHISGYEKREEKIYQVFSTFILT
jgi:membrane protease YdiL (CAAX protease family)